MAIMSVSEPNALCVVHGYLKEGDDGALALPG